MLYLAKRITNLKVQSEFSVQSTNKKILSGTIRLEELTTWSSAPQT